MVRRTVSASVLDLLGRVYAHDLRTHAHSRAVGAWSGLLAKALELDALDVRAALLAGTLHDVGKINTPIEILLERGPLTPEQWLVMHRHPGDGAALLAAIPELSFVAPIVRSHHERVDGRGYPDGLAGESIPPLARVVAVADAFEAMVTPRPYRHALPVDSALELLLGGRGSQWDAAIVDVMVGLVSAKTRRAGRSRERNVSAT